MRRAARVIVRALVVGVRERPAAFDAVQVVVFREADRGPFEEALAAELA